MQPHREWDEANCQCCNAISEISSLGFWAKMNCLCMHATRTNAKCRVLLADSRTLVYASRSHAWPKRLTLWGATDRDSPLASPVDAHKLQFCRNAAPKHHPALLGRPDRRSMLTNRTFSFLGSTSDRNAAFPGIDELDFVVEQDRHCQHGSKPNLKRYTKSDLPPQIRCVNPRCQQGGLATQGIVLHRGAGVHELWCKGHEGSPSGRRKGDPCDNSFIVTLRIDRSGSQGDE